MDIVNGPPKQAVSNAIVPAPRVCAAQLDGDVRHARVSTLVIDEAASASSILGEDAPRCVNFEHNRYTGSRPRKHETALNAALYIKRDHRIANIRGALQRPFVISKGRMP